MCVAKIVEIGNKMAREEGLMKLQFIKDLKDEMAGWHHRLDGYEFE